MKENERFFVGIDSGGTKCEVLITDKNKKKIFQKEFPGIHYSVSGPVLYSKNISGYIRSSLKISNLKLSRCMGICLGVAGAREEKDRKVLKKEFIKNLGFKNILVTTDAMTALSGAFGNEDGIILISGTGSVLYGRSGGEIIRTGGWGRIIGDEGSGYWIGKKGFNAIAKEFDLETINKKESLLRKALKENLNITKENLNRKVFDKDFEIQKAAPIVIECAENGEKVCREIIDEAVDGLFYLVQTYMKISKRKKPIEISYIGSIVENDNSVSRKLTIRIHSKLKNVKVVIKRHSSSYGAVFLAKNYLNMDN
jgi:N-acetylglucosamine kinase-like BadF-type ATPase